MRKFLYRFELTRLFLSLKLCRTPMLHWTFDDVLVAWRASHWLHGFCTNTLTSQSLWGYSPEVTSLGEPTKASQKEWDCYFQAAPLQCRNVDGQDIVICAIWIFRSATVNSLQMSRSPEFPWNSKSSFEIDGALEVSTYELLIHFTRPVLSRQIGP